MSMHSAPPVLLSGRFVLPDGDARQRYALIDNGRIRWISRSRPPAALIDGAREIRTGPQDWIYPGLLDLHTHSWYNMLPLWRSSRAPFANRYVWRSDAGYRQAIGGVLRQLKGHVPARKVFSELQAVAGGTTLLDEPRPLDRERSEGPTLLCRDTGSARDLGLPDGRQIRSIVDFFRPDESGQPLPAPGRRDKLGPIDAYVRDRHQLQATLVHLAEGRSGFGSYRGVDPYSRAEFEALMAHPSMVDIEAVRASRFSIVHGCGIDVDNPRHIDFLVRRGISIIWSPASNMLLYDDTIDAEKLIQCGVTVTLGSDWSPSGSKHVWDEAKFARFFLDAIGSPISDADIFKMVTRNPARCLGLDQVGRIEEGALADLFILRSPIDSDNALEVFFTTTDRDVLATIINGLPIYGDRAFLEPFGLELQALPKREGSAVANKVAHLPPAVEIDDFASAIDAIEDQMKAVDPPVLRSNLLATSDIQYQRRMQLLRSRTERFGWSVRQWRRRPPELDRVGRVPVAPDAVRLRIAFSKNGDAGSFRRHLAATYLPATTMLGGRCGVTASCSAVISADRPATCPAEIGLVFYDRREACLTAGKGIAGRACELLEGSLFDADRSWMDLPSRYDGTVASRQCYHLFDDAIDWQVGDVRALLSVRADGTDVESFHAAVVRALDDLQASPGTIDGAIAAVDDDYVVLWRHALSSPERTGSLRTALEAAGRTIFERSARDVEAKASLSDEFGGIELDPEGGDCLRLVFERRQLMPF